MNRKTSLWPALLLGASLLAASAAGLAATMYKWTDSEGNTHYTQTPPPQGNFKQLAGPRQPAPSEAAPPAETAAPAAPLKDDHATAEAERKRLEADVAKHNCAAARKNLEIYTSTRRIANEKGETEMLDDNVRAEKIKEANEMIKKYCQ